MVPAARPGPAGLEELTRLLQPIVEEAVRRNMDRLAGRVSDRLLADQVRRNTSWFYLNFQILFQTPPARSARPPGPRTRAGSAAVRAALGRALADWGRDTEQQGGAVLGLPRESGTSLQDFYLGKSFLTLELTSHSESK